MPRRPDREVLLRCASGSPRACVAPPLPWRCLPGFGWLSGLVLKGVRTLRGTGMALFSVGLPCPALVGSARQAFTASQTVSPGGVLAFAKARRSKKGKRRGIDRAAPAGTGRAGRRSDREKPLARRWTAVILVAICGISVLIGVLAFDSFPSIIGDNAEFVILARSMAAGNGFRYINHPDNRPATKYPLGFPALLAGWILLFGDSVVSMKVCVLVCYVAAVGLTFGAAKKLMGWTYGLVAAGLVATSAIVVAYSHQVLSDVPYMAFSLVGIYLLLSGRGGRRYLAAGLAVCIWALVVRSAGMSLVLAAVVFLFLKGRRKEAVATIGAALVVSVLWSLRNYSLTGEGSRYMQVLLSANPYDPDKGMLTFTGLVSRVFTNAGGYLGGLLPVTILPTLIRPAPGGGGGPLSILVSVLTLLVAALGAYGLRRKGLLPGLYMLAYFAVYLVWPEVWKSERFMVPVAPLLAIFLVWGLRTVLAYFDIKRVAILGACAALVFTNLFSLSTFAKRQRGYPLGWVRYLETAQWAGSHTDAVSVVMCRKPFLFNLFSNRKTIAYPFTRDKEVMREYLLEARPDFIVLDDFGGGTSATDVYVVPVLQDMLECIGLAYETEEPVNKVLVFRIPEGTGGS